MAAVASSAGAITDADWPRKGTTTIDSGDIDLVTSSHAVSGDVSKQERVRDDESPMSSGSHAEKSPKSDVSSPSSVENSPKHDASETKQTPSDVASDGDGGSVVCCCHIDHSLQDLRRLLRQGGSPATSARSLASRARLSSGGTRTRFDSPSLYIVHPKTSLSCTCNCACTCT